MKKKWISLTLAVVMIAGCLAGCNKPEKDKATNEPKEDKTTTESNEEKEPPTSDQVETDKVDLSGEIVFTIWDNNLMDYIDANDMVGKFQEKYPDIEVEVEKIKDDSEYWNAMKMRASANQLPDVMFNKPFTLTRFKDYLVDLTDTQASANNNLASGYAIDGKVLGIPMTAGYEYVYYWKDLFKEANVSVPTTWEELETVSATLQEYFVAKDKDFMAIALGAKDEWPNYPFTEFMPALVNGNGQNWNDMAKSDSPFSEGTDIYDAYQRINKLFSSGVFGKDPLGLGNDQATTLFAQKKAAIIALGDWGLQNIQNGAENIDELGTFYLPVRKTASEPFRYVVQGDSFMGVTTHSKNTEASIAFVEWFYSDAWYPDYLNYVTSASSMKNFPKDKHPILAQADAAQPDAEMVMYDGGGDDFAALQNETTFDYKKLGAQMFTKGFDLDKALEDLNSKWAAARTKLQIQ